MIDIVESQTGSRYLTEVTRLFQSEWPDFEPYTPVVNGFEVPLPILALSNADLVGGLAFTRFPEPNANRQALWINAVLVEAKSRKQGVSSNLIRRAESLAKHNGELSLYVYTHIPTLYQKLGWEVTDTSDEHMVLRKTLS
ncbi:GNAT family N-acetyltransferase [Vibrio tapetis subsp. quintayensis]|uniref:GNAT family N-acetyltransferase n=1 Tax=Vibrio tapetis TaxID=52443 RepID=UPI0025B36AE5|nr:GNAT family N-acetyltransferase [Vibrio tapetis]MDN3679104.1 GNAT family N-acetyltransferase [Vibrio tapetis subsp. quintayensis]